MEGEPARKTSREVPWVVHLLVVGLSAGAVAFFAPFLIPMLAVPFATFAALSTVLFPIFRRNWGLVLVNYLLAAVVAIILFFRG